MESSIKELIKMKGNIKEKDLIRAKAQLKSGLLMSQERSMSRLETNVHNIFTFNKIITDEEALNMIETLELSQLERALERVLENKKPVLSIIGPNSNLFSKHDLKNYF